MLTKTIGYDYCHDDALGYSQRRFLGIEKVAGDIIKGVKNIAKAGGHSDKTNLEVRDS